MIVGVYLNVFILHGLHPNVHDAGTPGKSRFNGETP